MSQHFKKRKARTAPPPVLRRSEHEQNVVPAAPAAPTTENATLTAALTALKVSLKRDMSSFVPPTPVASPIHSRLPKRARFECGVLLPDIGSEDARGSPAASSTKPALPLLVDMGTPKLKPTTTTTTTQPQPVHPKTSPVPKARVNAFLTISNKLTVELERRRRKHALSASERHAQRARQRRQELSFFAIAGAFHRAAHERERALKAQPVE